MTLSTFEIHHLARSHPEELARVVRSAALSPPILAYALEEIGATCEGVATVALLWAGLLDPAAEVRRGAALGIGTLALRTQDPAALVCIDKLREIGLTDPSKAVRDEAAAALVVLEAPTDEPKATIYDPPPLGLMPRWLHEEHRALDIIGAIGRYKAAGRPVPEEWEAELDEVQARIRQRPDRAPAVVIGRPDDVEDATIFAKALALIDEAAMELFKFQAEAVGVRERILVLSKFAVLWGALELLGLDPTEWEAEMDRLGVAPVGTLGRSSEVEA